MDNLQCNNGRKVFTKTSQKKKKKSLNKKKKKKQNFKPKNINQQKKQNSKPKQKTKKQNKRKRSISQRPNSSDFGKKGPLPASRCRASAVCGGPRPSGSVSPRRRTAWLFHLGSCKKQMVDVTFLQMCVGLQIKTSFKVWCSVSCFTKPVSWRNQIKSFSCFLTWRWRAWMGLLLFVNHSLSILLDIKCSLFCWNQS